MRACGVAVEIGIWPRVPHVWHLWAPFLPEANRALAEIGAFADRRLRLRRRLVA